MSSDVVKQSSFGPTVSLGTTLSDNTASDLNGSVSLSIKMPFYKGGQRNSKLRKSYALVHASNANLKQKTLMIKQNISQSWSESEMARLDNTGEPSSYPLSYAVFYFNRCNYARWV